MKYKVGNKIKIKPFEWFDDQYIYYSDGCVRINGFVIDGSTFIGEMSRYCDYIAIITEVDKKHSYYKINIDNGEYCWTESMFDDVAMLTKDDINEKQKLIEHISEYINDNGIRFQLKEDNGRIIIEETDKNDLPIGTICFVSNFTSSNPTHFKIRKYSGNMTVYIPDEENIYDKNTISEKYNVIIPFDKFDPYNIEESLKYNIVK